MVIKKKVFPKLKKKIKWFLTDESGKITKKDALGLAVGAMLLSSVDEATAASCEHANNSFGTGHLSWYNAWWHANWYQHWTDIEWTKIWTFFDWVETTHASGIVNWHYSGTPDGWDYAWYLAWDHANWMQQNWWSFNAKYTTTELHWFTGVDHSNSVNYSHCSCSRWM